MSAAFLMFWFLVLTLAGDWVIGNQGWTLGILGKSTERFCLRRKDTEPPSHWIVQVKQFYVFLHSLGGSEVFQKVDFCPVNAGC